MRSTVLSAACLALCLPATGPLRAQQHTDLDAANDAAGVLVMERLKARDGRGHALLCRCPAEWILLVDGRHDHTDRVLRSLGVSFATCAPEDLARHSLRGVRLLILDCPGDVTAAAVTRVRDFAQRGGTLLSTDWSVDRVLEQAFPGRVSYSGRPTADDVVRIDRVASDPLLRWVFPDNRLAAWWLENQSHPIEVIGRDVDVLLSSSEMGRRYGSSAVAVRFRAGRGRVVHLVSHTYLQRTVCVHPWELRSAEAEAAALDLPTGSEGYRGLQRAGVLGRLRAGDLHSALSAQQFLVNLLLAAFAGDAATSPPAPDPTPRPPPPTEPPLTRGSALRSTHLWDSPDGRRDLAVTRGLRLAVLERRGAWCRVRTPAGQSGWIRSADLAEDR